MQSICSYFSIKKFCLSKLVQRVWAGRRTPKEQWDLEVSISVNAWTQKGIVELFVNTFIHYVVMTFF